MLPWLAVETLKGLGFAALILAILKLFADNVIKSLFQRDLESHKASLQLEAEKELAQVRARNETLLAEYKEKVSHLSRERIEAIRGVSQRLIAVWAALEAITAFMKDALPEGQSEADRAKEEFQVLGETSNEFLSHLKTVEIFFPAALSDRMFEFRRQMSIIYSVWGRVLSRYLPDDKRIENWQKVADLKVKFDPEFIGLRNELRKLLGIDE